jgi:hypothetical protein
MLKIPCPTIASVPSGRQDLDNLAHVLAANLDMNTFLEQQFLYHWSGELKEGSHLSGKSGAVSMDGRPKFK